MFGPSRRVARRTARRTTRRQLYLQDQMGGRYGEPAYAEPEYQPAPTAEEPDFAEELTKLATLQKQGIISAEEFEAKKKQILGI